jgi:phage baseplate assembly protein V
MDYDTDNAFPRTKIGRDRQVRDLFRSGTVIDRKHDQKRGPLVRVQFPDKQGLITQWIPVKQFGSRSTSHYYCPKIGDSVNVTMQPNSSEDGFVDGSFFNEENPPPSGVDLDTRQFQTEDGTTIQYSEGNSTFTLTDQNGPVMVTAEMISLTAPIILINGNIQHTGLMNTSGVHTDANGLHMGGTAARQIDVAAEINDLKKRIQTLEQAVLST